MRCGPCDQGDMTLMCECHPPVTPDPRFVFTQRTDTHCFSFRVGCLHVSIFCVVYLSLVQFDVPAVRPGLQLCISLHLARAGAAVAPCLACLRNVQELCAQAFAADRP